MLRDFKPFRGCKTSRKSAQNLQNQINKQLKFTVMKTAKTFIIEVEKHLDWNAGYLNYGKVVEDIKEAQEFDSEEEAEDEASLFNIEYGKGGKILARVR